MAYPEPDRWSETSDEEEFFDNKMSEYETEALESVRLFVKGDLAENFAAVLAWGWYNEDDDAEQLAERLSLSKLHIYAILKYEQEFKEEFYNEFHSY